tara:strand:- start:222 stop:902 length:681 start_codon:yes stop_codon:yes gene_type:complete
VTLRKKYVNGSLINKTCNKCGNTYPRTENYFYRVKHRTKKNCYNYLPRCITCELERTNEYKRRYNRTKGPKTELAYRQSEKGYFNQKWNTVRRSKKICLIKTFEEFMQCWERQKEKYGEYCPYYPHIKLTRILGRGRKGKIDSNLSVDRLVNCLPYSKDNIMFVSWRANNEKGEVSYYLARKMTEFIEENERLRLFVDMDTFERNNKEFDFKKYHKMRRRIDNEME